MIIKVLLILGLLGVAAYSVRAHDSASHLAARRMVASIALVAGVLAVLLPSVTNRLAHMVGVSRGADLLTYGFVVLSMFVWVSGYRRILELESRMVTLTRQIALMDAVEPTMAAGTSRESGGS